MANENPYILPQVSKSVPSSAVRKAPVWPWYVAYCVMMCLLYVIVAVVSVGLLVFGGSIPDLPDEDRIGLLVQGTIMAVMSLPLMVLFGMGPFVPKKKWGWIYGFVPICIGLTSPCCMPFSIPLLIFWLKPETKRFFHAE